MSRFIKIFLCGIFAVPLFGGELQAQRPFERFQGWRPDGRILREIFGQNDEDVKERDRENERSKQRDPRSRSQTTGRRGEPTPAQTRRPSSQNSNRSVSELRNRNVRPSSPQRGVQKAATRLEVSLRESEKPEGLVVDKISKDGAAWAAGIRQGDLLTRVGGLEISGKEELASILKVLKDGDQIEFEYVRRGKKDTTLVQFGESGEIENEESESAPDYPSTRAREARANYHRPRSINGNSSLNSVLDGKLNRQGSSRGANSIRPASEKNKWLVQPPSTDRSQPRPATTRPASNSSEVLELRRELERKQREIENLQRRIRNASDSKNQDSQPDLDSLFEIDK